MGGLSLMHWLVVGIFAVLVLGGGRFSNMMGDVAKGIKNFKKAMAEEDDSRSAAPATPVAPVARIEGKAAPDPVVTPEGERAHDTTR